MTKLLSLTIIAGAMALAAPAMAIINAPVPTDNYITFGGNDWAWAAPCAPYGNSCGPVDMNYQSTQGWRIAEVADFAFAPSAADFGPSGSDFKCASAYFSTSHAHCDYGDGSQHVIFNHPQNPLPGYSTVETWVIRSGAPAVPEPATWALFIGGFGAIGATMRRRKLAIA